MADSYTHKSLAEVEDAAAKFGHGEKQEAHFAGDELDAEQSGFSYHVVKPRMRQGFGHRHEDVEEVYVVIGGGGRVKLDDKVVELKRLDAVRVSPGVTRAFEADVGGLEILAFSPKRTDDRGEIIEGWWGE
jgi:mannose-6-phosphate isomerase-like protein (cupin superfamily)